jgi:hypothetical protein
MPLGLPMGLQNSEVPVFANQYSVAFDDVDDWMSTASADGTLAIRTYSFWAKTTETTANPVFGHGAVARGAFHLTHSVQRNLLYMAASNYRYWVANSAIYDGNWHHHVVFISTTITDTKYYVDGVAQTATITNAAGGQNSYTHSCRIGRAATTYFDGSLDEFAIFDGELSAANVLAIYNNGNPADLSRFNPVAWWRMGDGDVGTTTLTDHGSGGNNATLQSGAAITLNSP